MEALDMIINELPSPTWHHLRMNQAKVSQVMVDKEGSCEKKIPAEAVLTTDGNLAEKYDAISSGSGKDIDRLAKEAQIVPQIYKVSKDQTVSSPVFFKFSYTDGEKVMNQVGFETEENAEMTILMDYSSHKNSDGIGAVQTKLYAGKNSLIRLIQVQRIGQEMTFFNDIGGVCEDNGRIEIIQLVLSGRASYMGCQIDLKGDSSTMQSDIGYMVNGDRKLDINYLVRAIGRTTDCVINAGGSLQNSAEKIFRGTIDFVKGSSGSVGNEKEEVLLLDENCVNKTIPLILCAVEDVVGNHGATIGRPDEDLLFYLNSRGITEKEAISMLARAKVDAVAGLIPEEEFRHEILEYVKDSSQI